MRVCGGHMRYREIITERRSLNISDMDRAELIKFIMDWFNGRYMTEDVDLLSKWQRIQNLFPHNIRKPIRLMRVVTLPIAYANQKHFHLQQPAPKAVGSWTSTHFGLDSVHAIATEFNAGSETCRIAIQAVIQPTDILASYKSLKRAYLALLHDYDYDKFTDKNGNYLSYLGVPASEYSFHDDLGYFQGIFRDQRGGPLRQYEFVVKTTPVDATNIRVFRRGDETYLVGHDDPHYSGSFRGYSKDRY